MTGFVVVNPRSGGGRTARDWPQIELALRSAYPHMELAMTQSRGDATALVRDALREGYHEIVAVGGDGTINEAVNGLFDADGPIMPDAVFGFISSGAEGNFRKTFGLAPGYVAAIARLRQAPVQRIDIGRLSCLSLDGKNIVRYFANISSFGFSGAVMRAAGCAHLSKLFGKRFAIACSSLRTKLSWRDRMIRLRIDTEYDEIIPISTVAVANGQFFGDGRRVAPEAVPNDGLFDIVVMGGVERARSASDTRELFKDSQMKSTSVRAFRGRRIMAVPVAETRGRPVLVEIDGDCAGRLPATFELLPRALNLRC
ncbi:MAG TPA: diacylglycerol kinase family protein [Rhizomicrobium sp.]